MSGESQPLVSVVTPVYNGAKYLAQCVESVLRQTYTNWEYVIVDNCSADGTADICKKYDGKDSRIRAVRNEVFLPQMENWNHTLRQMSAESTYCKVVHADDWLFPECITEMIALAEAHPSVGVVGSYGLRGARVTWDGLPYPSTVVKGREICRMAFLGNPYVFGTPTSVLIRSDLIRKRPAFYNEGNIHADKEACFDVLQECDFGFVHQVLTYTRMHDETVTAFCDRVNSYLLGNLIIMKNYGRVYLGQDEYERCLKAHMRKYFSFLGRSVMRRRDKEFWEFHRKGLQKVGCRVQWGAIMKEPVVEVLDMVLNPKRTIERIVRKAQSVIGGNGRQRGRAR